LKRDAREVLSDRFAARVLDKTVSEVERHGRDHLARRVLTEAMGQGDRRVVDRGRAQGSGLDETAAAMTEPSARVAVSWAPRKDGAFP
jgi:hypothetical protein